MEIKDGQIARFQLEIRFSQILEFNSIIKKIASPYSKLSSRFEFLNEGRHNEILTLVFEKEEFYIDCRWDRLILVSAGGFNKFDDENSTPIRTFFDLFRNLSSEKNFGTVLNYILLIVIIKKFDNTLKEITDGFLEKFIKDPTSQFFKNIDDIAITVDKKLDQRTLTIGIGPYSEKDMEIKNLFPFRNTNFLNFKDTIGKMVEINLFENNSIIDEKNYKVMYKEIKKAYNELEF